MRQLLVINPNTSHSVSALLQTHAQAAAGPHVLVKTVTARFGAPYIACEASYAIASHALLDRWAAELKDNPQPPHAILIGCFGDPGLLALRQGSAAPVTGLAEAAFAEAAALGRFAVVTGGASWKPMLERLAYSLGHAPALAGIHTVTPSGAELASNPQAAVALLQRACQEAAARWGAKSIVLGGAGLAGLAAQIEPHMDIPVIDSVLAGTRSALALAPTARRTNSYEVPWVNLAPEFMALGERNKLNQV